MTLRTVARVRHGRDRARAIAVRSKEILHVRGEPARRLLAFDGQTIRQSPTDLVIQAVARDGIDHAWAQFLRTDRHTLDSTQSKFQ